MELDVLDALGRPWDDDALRAFVTTLQIAGEPHLQGDDLTTFPQNLKLGVELTFTPAEELKVRQPDYPRGALALHNIRFYGAGSSTHAPFTGTLPLGIRFSDTRQTLIEKLGPPDSEVTLLPSPRWDTARYARFVVLGDDGTVLRVALQTPNIRRLGSDQCPMLFQYQCKRSRRLPIASLLNARLR